MYTALDCIPCFLRQALEAARMNAKDPVFHQQVMHEVLDWLREMKFDQSPPVMAQRIHRRLRELTGIDDPYFAAKARQNQIALEILPAFKSEVQSSPFPLITAARIAIAGNMIDMGVNGNISYENIYQNMQQALSGPFYGSQEAFLQAIAGARSILYLADNAGEIAFDRLLIEQILPKQVTLVVRGSPVINDATRVDVQAVGLDQLVEVVDNGSDAPGTLLEDCSQDFRRRFAEADLILAKGQGNFESLSHLSGHLFFLFQVKCSLVASHIHVPVGTQVLAQATRELSMAAVG